MLASSIKIKEARKETEIRKKSRANLNNKKICKSKKAHRGDRVVEGSCPHYHQVQKGKGSATERLN